MGVLEKPTVADLVGWLERRREVVRHRIVPRNPGAFADPPDWLHPSIAAALRSLGIDRLYSHQRQAIDLAHAGSDLVVVTPTASGKTLCYNLPVLDSLLRDPSGRALYLFPTKALGNDQMRELRGLISALKADIKVHTFDGDTPQDARRAIRAVGHAVITNPDMLHQGMLPHHTKWAKLFSNLRYIVIDEIHTYRGVFGSHLANVLRRLLRVCAFYGARPVFVCCSATIANPGELAALITGRQVAVVDDNGAPSGERHFFLWNPPVVNQELGLRASYLKQARNVALKFLASGSQMIVFARSRLNVERLVRDLSEGVRRLRRSGGAVRAYRGGYLPGLRREIEQGLKSGQVQGVVSTNALELGIDIGGLDLCVIAGYPGTIASARQQAGRVGRRQGASVAVLVASSNPLDQYIATHPEWFFDGGVEHARINPDNLVIVASHIKCAAFELPFADGERFGGLLPEETGEILAYLSDHRVVHRADGRYHWIADSYPANEISLRSATEGNFAVIDTSEGGERVIGEVDFHSAPETIHEKAIYLVEGVPYQVRRFDWEGRKAYVERATTDYFTDAMTYSRVAVLEVFDTTDEGGVAREQGEVRINREVVGFKKIRFDTAENVGYDEVRLPEQELHTEAYWFTLPEETASQLGLSPLEVVEGLIGAGYALHTAAAVLLMADPRDIDRCVGDKSARWFAIQPEKSRGGYSSVNPRLPEELAAADAFSPTLFIFDNYPGGMGFSRTLYARHHELLRAGLEAVAACPCARGCPACVGPVNESGTRSKGLALALLSLLAGRHEH